MNGYISVEKLIEEATSRGINFGKGDPYNRLRYYTKIGWLPNMKRKMDTEGNVKGHYPSWAVERLILIESLKERGENNEEISKKLQIKNRFQSIRGLISEKESRNQLVMYSILLLLAVIVLNEFGVLKIGKPKDAFTSSLLKQLPNQITDSGSAFVPKDQKNVFIKTPLVKSNAKIYVNFSEDYSPATRYWVSDIREYEGFLVTLDTPVFVNAGFYWWVTN